MMVANVAAMAGSGGGGGPGGSGCDSGHGYEKRLTSCWNLQGRNMVCSQKRWKSREPAFKNAKPLCRAREEKPQAVVMAEDGKFHPQ